MFSLFFPCLTGISAENSARQTAHTANHTSRFAHSQLTPRRLAVFRHFSAVATTLFFSLRVSMGVGANRRGCSSGEQFGTRMRGLFLSQSPVRFEKGEPNVAGATSIPTDQMLLKGRSQCPRRVLVCLSSYVIVEVAFHKMPKHELEERRSV